MRKSLNFLTLLLITSSLTNAYQEERSILDAYLPLLRRLKSIVFNAVEAKSNTRESQRTLRLKRKLQSIPNGMKFPCNLENSTLRSKDVPQSVHKLRPGDIDVIGAIGDSLTAGFGVVANNPLEVLHEGRGSVFSIVSPDDDHFNGRNLLEILSVGGEETWRTQLTIPNILKNFNPNIYGYSLDSISIDRKSKFNVAEGGAISQNMPYMAKVLVKRITKDRKVNVEKDWKMITIFIGHNDFCSVNCYLNDLNKILSDHKRDMLEVLRYFKRNLPRTVVNLIPPIHMQILATLKDKPPICEITHLVSCPCMIGLPNLHLRNKMDDIMTKWQNLDNEIANYPEFDKDDFTVILHKFTMNYTLPELKDGGTDYGYAAPDCFHASQRGHAKLANDLWNSILETYAKKSMNTQPEFERFLCPSRKNPYIFTKRNSKMG